MDGIHAALDHLRSRGGFFAVMTVDVPIPGMADAQTIAGLKQRANRIRQHIIQMSLSAQGGTKEVPFRWQRS
jgi:hypothetical protein